MSPDKGFMQNMQKEEDLLFFQKLHEKAQWVWRETLLIHKHAPETRIASSLSPIEILVCLFYGKILAYDPKNPFWAFRDRLIISKAHGSVCIYPILADLGYFDPTEIGNVCKHNSFLGGIPDPIVPGIETANGSLGHGLGVGCGVALALERKDLNNYVFVIVGDGELNEGAVWEAVMFAGHHKLKRLILIVDNNAKSMLDYSEKIIRMNPIIDKFCAFGWQAYEADGHNINQVYSKLRALKDNNNNAPCALVCNTIKGRGVDLLENDPVCHVRSLSSSEVTDILSGTKGF